MTNFGTVMVNGQEIVLSEQADFTNRQLTDWQMEEGIAEFAANGIDAQGNKVRVFWLQKSRDVEDLSDLDWSEGDRVERLGE
ncbi:hypothetical protein ACFSR7_06100 [Cohnella sp. GCM10020058]|uniref:hypothetical protein n=1 Tax=Cohnella sp. GCM10020058 TaxID=3317330 RepID=UPI0036453DCE